ncbi:MAG: NAD-dependent epimerase/dehydratase family protein [Acidobacteriaceae bacterium]
MSIRIILTGATGMVGEGVLLECLQNPAVAEVLMVNRRPSPRRHPKLKECLVPDFFDLNAVTRPLTGYDACFFAAGVSSLGRSEAEYTRLTYDLTLHFAETLVTLNPGMVFIYVSGAMTDSTEKGRTMWARVKGRTENALQRLGFRAVYNFRPGFMRATPGQQNLPFFYRLIGPLYPVVRVVLPNQVSTLSDVGRAMIRCVLDGYPRPILEIRDINALAKS